MTYTPYGVEWDVICSLTHCLPISSIRRLNETTLYYYYYYYVYYYYIIAGLLLSYFICPTYCMC